jgi:hypothetical protein
MAMLLLSSGFSNTSGSCKSNELAARCSSRRVATHLIAQLQETLQPGTAVLWALALKAVRQQKHNAILALKTKI